MNALCEHTRRASGQGRSWRFELTAAVLVSLAASIAVGGCSDDPAASTEPTPDAASDAYNDAEPEVDEADIAEADIAEADVAEAGTEIDAEDAAPDVRDDGESDASDGSGEGVDAGPDVPSGMPYPEPGAWPANHGPGGPARSFTEDELYVNCSFLDGGERDITDHHNLVVMTDGYLVMPWAPEWGHGGLTFFDVSDPCEPTVVGTGFSETMRETHAMGFANFAGGKWAVVNQLGGPLLIGRAGIQFWDISDPTAPEAVADMELPNAFYPDSYARVPLSVFWQAPYAYVAGADNGVYVVDATDPTAPEFVTQFEFDPILRAGQIHAIGNLLVVTAAGGPRTALMDISDPRDPRLINEFTTNDEFDLPRENYFSTVSGGYSWYARKDNGGGLFVYDITDPRSPAKAGQVLSLGNGGYVFIKDDLAFVGESGSAVIYDVSDLDNIFPVTRLDLEGDLDTLTPIGNMAVLAADDEAVPDEGSAMAPYATEPDSQPPRVTWVYPDDQTDDEDAEPIATTSRIGISFSEMVDPGSAWEGSVRLYETGTDSSLTRVEGILSTQEGIVNFHPVEPLAPDTRYTLDVPAGGVSDFNGNAIEEPFTMTFRTAQR